MMAIEEASPQAEEVQLSCLSRAEMTEQLFQLTLERKRTEAELDSAKATVNRLRNSLKEQKEAIDRQLDDINGGQLTFSVTTREYKAEVVTPVEAAEDEEDGGDGNDDDPDGDEVAAALAEDLDDEDEDTGEDTPIEEVDDEPNPPAEEYALTLIKEGLDNAEIKQRTGLRLKAIDWLRKQGEGDANGNETDAA